MIPTKPLFLSAAVLLTACINLPEVAPPDLTVTLATPGGTTYTNGTVGVQLQIQGDTPANVELLVDDQPLATLQAPYSFTWDTTSVQQGTYRLSARAQLGDSTFSSEVREVVVDRTPPSVLTLSPENNDLKVSIHQPIQVTFSEPVMASSVTGDSVRVLVRNNRSSGYAAQPFSLDLQANRATISPTPPPAPFAAFHIELEPSITDLAGNPLVPPSSWEFEVPAWTGLDPLREQAGVGRLYPPNLQIDAQGRPVVLWREKSASDLTSNLYVKRFVAGQGWEPLGGAVNSTPIPADYASKTVLEVLQFDSTGTPFVAWLQPDGPTPGIVVKSLQNNEWITLGLPIGIANYQGSPATLPQSLALKLDSKNLPHVAWIQSDTPRSRSYLYVADFNLTMHDWLYDYPYSDVSPSYSTNSVPISLDFLNGDRTQPMVTWDSPEGVSVAYKISYWRFLPLAQAHPEASTPTGSPIVMDVSGLGVVIAFTEFDGFSDNIHVQRWTGDAWLPLGDPLSATPGSTSTYYVKMAKDSHDNIYTLWSESDGSNSPSYKKHVRRWLNEGTTWETLGNPIEDFTGANDSLVNPAFAVDASGTPYMAWMNRSAESIYVYRLNQ